MNRKITLAFCFCFVMIFAYGQKKISPGDEKNLWNAALQNKDKGQWDTLENCSECYDIRMSGIASPIIGVEGGGKDSGNLTDCDSTFNIKLDSVSIITLINIYIKSIVR
jgi:hypothetical protein